MEHRSSQLVCQSHFIYLHYRLRNKQLLIFYSSGLDGYLCRWNVMDALHSRVLAPTYHSTLTPPLVKPVHLVSLSCDYFALVGVAREGTPRLSIWDVSYLTNQASSSLSGPASTFHHVCCVWGCVLVCGDESVTLINTTERSNSGTLAAALGRGQSSTAVSGDQRLSESVVKGISIVQVHVTL